MKITVPLLILTIILNGCTMMPCPWQSDLETVTVAPENNDLVGSYKPDARTLERFEGFTKDSKLVLHRDSLYTFHDLPVQSFNGMAQSYKDKIVKAKNVNGTGKWKTYTSSGPAEILVSIDFEEQNRNGDHDYETSWRIYKKEGQYAVVFIVGDPDECSVIRLIKENKLQVTTE